MHVIVDGVDVGVKRCSHLAEAKGREEKARPAGFAKAGNLLPNDWSKEKPAERKQPSDAEIQKGGGIEYAAARAALLPKPECEIAAIVLNHRGKQNAITIEDICKVLWTNDWNGFGLDAEQLRRKRNDLIRTVKASVERIRKEGRIPVAACKGSPGGYFVPETADEADEYAQRVFGEAIKMMRTARLFSPQRNWVEEMRGQLQL